MYLGKVKVAEELVLVLEERAHEARGVGRSRFGRHAGLYRTEYCVSPPAGKERARVSQPIVTPCFNIPLVLCADGGMYRSLWAPAFPA
jgi:hypothetical protein